MSGKVMIKPTRLVLRMDLPEADVIWQCISTAIDEIYRKNASALSYEILYRHAYNLILAKHGDFLYEKAKGKISQHLRQALADLSGVLNENLLTALADKWRQHNQSVGLVKDILMYMDSQYAVQQKKHTVYTFGLVLYRDIIIYNENIRFRLQKSLLEAVAEERMGNLIDHNVIATILSMLSDLCVDGISVYEEEFEIPFLNETSIYYKEESLKYLSTYNVPQYLVKAEEKLKEEAQRVTNYLDKSSESKLLGLVETELLQLHCKTILDSDKNGLQYLFQEDKLDDLHRLFALFSRIPNCVDALRESMVAFVKVEGMAIVGEQEKANNSVLFMEKLFALKHKFERIISESFKDDKKFARRFKEALEDFMNRDSKCSGYLAAYADHVLKAGNLEETSEPFDAVAERILTLFRYIHDKDIFEAFFRNHMAKRLLHGRSSSEDNERLMVSKLKTECGNQYTAKLEGMLTDISISKKSLEDFKQSAQSRGFATELDLSLLTTGYWPSQVVPSCNLAPSLRDCQDSFTAFYTNTNNGRKLTWHNHMGSVDIKASFKGGKRDLTVSTYQACILDLFNKKVTLSLDEIRAATCIVEPELRRHLLSLCTPKVKILNKSSKDKDILDTDEFTFNDDFTSKYRRIKVPLIVAKELVDESSDAVPSSVEDDRRMLLEAVIVRIMKARKTLSHNHLLEEINRQVSNRFNPSPAAIKARIESLIEREFLKRDEKDQRKYNYQA